MKRNKLPTYKIFSFDDIDLDILYTIHLSLKSGEDVDPDYPEIVKNVLKQAEEVEQQTDNPTPRKKELIEKYQFLIHLIITKTFIKGYNTFNANLLQGLFGRSYTSMLKNICNLGYISRSNTYSVGQWSRTITILKTNIICKQVYDHSFEKYYQKYLEYREKGKVLKDHFISNELIGDFTKQYKSSMKRLKIVDEDAARLFIKENSSLSEYAKQRYNWILEKYINKEFNVSTDKDNRIYSVLSSTPKDIKQFINIKYQLDICNSHPLLFSYYLINKYNIHREVLNIISNINITNNIYYNKTPYSYIQYDMKVFDKLLNDNNIKYKNINNIKLDQLFYIYLTFHGQFWDVFQNIDVFEKTPRSIIKQEMFKEVFYGNILGGRRRLYADLFKRIFPNVYKNILNRRKEFRSGEKCHLSHDMMALESEIIQKILRRLYRLGYIAVNIHDAIVVVDVEENNDLQSEDVQRIINEEYLKYDLYSSTKVDYFNPNNAMDRLSAINENERKIKSIIKDLQANSLDPNNPNQKMDLDLYTDLITGRNSIEFDEAGDPILIFNH